MIKVFVFRCKGDSKTVGFTKDESGSNLPVGEVCKMWVMDRQLEVTEEKPLLGVDVKEMIKSIDKTGYYLSSYNISVTETIIKPQ